MVNLPPDPPPPPSRKKLPRCPCQVDAASPAHPATAFYEETAPTPDRSRRIPSRRGDSQAWYVVLHRAPTGPCMPLPDEADDVEVH
ncbi:hypothetical protein B0H10DRAFT_2236859 [Mycena sp. CBHHK59/15]|nr:hypothetical protein B0H10DRAFT_2236859 [Mycena sp. CBHHK59/15]